MRTVYPKPTLSVMNYEAFSYYRDNTPRKTDKITNRAEYAKVLKTIFRKASQALLENDSGVVLDRIGYFAPLRHPVKSISRGYMFYNVEKQGEASFYNLHTDRYYYYLKLFTNIHNNNTFMHWSMDYGFKFDLMKEFVKKLKGGKKYKLQYTLVRDLLKNKK